MADILVIDDEEEIRDLMSRVLAREGHHVDVVVHGAAALEALKASSYDLVICNIRMPVMDGPTLYARVLDRDKALAGRFVFCTGDIVSPDVRSFLLSINQPVLIKPFSIANLRETVHSSLIQLAGGPHTAPRQPGEHLIASGYPA
jgi:CheY-like chemotaxis protein